MTPNDDRDLKKWAADWQAAPYDVETAEQIRHYVKKRGGLIWSFMVADFVIGGIALPVLIAIGWLSESRVERMAMLSLASITIATVGFGWWNWRGTLRASATSITEYVAISAERIRRMRLAWRVAWVVLAAQVILFSIWIWDMLYARPVPHLDAERFAWGWLGFWTLGFVVFLIFFGRWIRRDAARFEALKRELEDRS
jgi:hypothetical protein